MISVIRIRNSRITSDCGCDKIGIAVGEKCNTYVGRYCLSVRWTHISLLKPSPEARNGESSKERFEMQIKTVLDTPAAVKHLTAGRKQERKKTFYNNGPCKAIASSVSGGSNRSSLISYPKSLSKYPYNTSALCAVSVFYSVSILHLPLLSPRPHLT